jgi:hypothetical protein
MRELIYEMIKLEDELCETIKDTQSVKDRAASLFDCLSHLDISLFVAVS